MDFEQTLIYFWSWGRILHIDKSFVKISTSWRHVDICIRKRSFYWIASQTKCRSSSKCFVLECIIGFATIRTTLRLSEKIIWVMVETCNSLRMLMIYFILVKVTTILTQISTAWDNFLFFFMPGNQIGAKEDNKPSSWFAIIKIRSPACINKSLKFKLWTTM